MFFEMMLTTLSVTREAKSVIRKKEAEKATSAKEAKAAEKRAEEPKAKSDSIPTTKNDELVVVCVPKNEDYMIYWYNKNGALKWKIPLLANYLPQNDEEVFTSIDRIVPDYSEMKLYIKTDYYKVSTDEELNVQSGIEYSHSLMHQFNVEEETFSTPLEIPPYEDVIVDRFAKVTYKIPYNFLI